MITLAIALVLLAILAAITIRSAHVATAAKDRAEAAATRADDAVRATKHAANLAATWH